MIEKHSGPSVAGVADLFLNYPLGRAFDEMFAAPGTIRPAYQSVHTALSSLSAGDLKARADIMGRTFLDQGITFALGGVERPFPLDLIPRIVTGAEWVAVQLGVPQRVRALGGVPGRRVRAGPDLHRRRHPAPAGHHLTPFPPSGRRYDQPGRRAHRHLRGRSDPRRARHLPRAGGQRAGAVRSLLCAGEPAGRDPGAGRGRGPTTRCGRWPNIRAGCWPRFAPSPHPGSATRRWWCSRPASTTRPTSSTPCWPGRWESNWSRAET